VTSRAPTLSGWGRMTLPGREIASERLESITAGATLTRGLGRSYGDSSLPAQASDKIASTILADRILAFDNATGVLRAEAGISLAQLNRVSMPRGFFTPVTPGTELVTLGGMVASDVHGKNHHRQGCFGAHVRSLRVRLADDSIVESDFVDAVDHVACRAAQHPRRQREVERRRRPQRQVQLRLLLDRRAGSHRTTPPQRL